MDQALLDALAAAGAAIDAGEDYSALITQDQLNKLLIIEYRNKLVGNPDTP